MPWMKKSDLTSADSMFYQPDQLFNTLERFNYYSRDCKDFGLLCAGMDKPFLALLEHARDLKTKSKINYKGLKEEFELL